MRPPCYFNTGCCSFPDGDVTGIEIADGEIRLVRWPRNLAELRNPEGDAIAARLRIRESEPLADVLDRVAAPAEPEILTRPMLPP